MTDGVDTAWMMSGIVLPRGYEDDVRCAVKIGHGAGTTHAADLGIARIDVFDCFFASAGCVA